LHDEFTAFCQVSDAGTASGRETTPRGRMSLYQNKSKIEESIERKSTIFGEIRRAPWRRSKDLTLMGIIWIARGTGLTGVRQHRSFVTGIIRYNFY
jgi:hypothetical protein